MILKQNSNSSVTTAERVDITKCGAYQKHTRLTWTGGSQSGLPDSNLDHAYASTNLSFSKYPDEHGVLKDVDVRGWVNYTGLQQDRWLDDYSDHSLLYFEIQQTD